MSTKKIKVAIGESLGWTCVHGEWINPENEQYETLPNYIGDLNAMYKAEEFLYKTYGAEKWFCYLDNLSELCIHGETAVVHATAEMKAIAYLKAMELWKK